MFDNDFQIEGKFRKAETYGQESGEEEVIQPSDEEAAILEKIRGVWSAILKTDVLADTDFFGAGAGSMDVVRLVEEVWDKIYNNRR